MSVRTRLAGAVAVVATASAALTLLPGTANAATPSPAGRTPLSLSVGHVQPGRLLPGGQARTFTVSVTNHGGRAESFSGELAGFEHGALSLSGNDVRVAVRPVHAPATTSLVGGQDGGLIGAFYPKGGHWGTKFTIPAHTTYTWKVSVEATKAFPINDDRLKMNVMVGAENNSVELVRSVNYRVGHGHTGGPIVTTVTGGDTVNVTRPLVLDVRWTNHTGAALATAQRPWVSERGPANSPKLAFDIWNGKHWVPAGTWDASLKALPAGLANGASVTEKIRVRIVGRADQAVMGPVTLGFAYDAFVGGWTTKVIETTNQ